MRGKILIIDDEEIITNMLKIFLSSEGAVECAGNGREALDKIAVTTYDVLIVDVDMPVMNGIAFYKEAVKTFSGIKERVIFFTGAHEESSLTFFKDNNLRYLAKSLGPQDLMNSVREILGRNRAGDWNP